MKLLINDTDLIGTTDHLIADLIYVCELVVTGTTDRSITIKSNSNIIRVCMIL